MDRIDLDGNAAGVVTELEAVNAQKGVAQQKRKPKTVETPPPGKPAPRRDGLAALKRSRSPSKSRSVTPGAHVDQVGG